MKIDINLLKEERKISLQEKINMSNRDTNDALIKQINYIDAKVDAFMISSGEISIKASYVVNTNYLDARTLRELVLDFEYEEEMLFTTNRNKEIELSIDYVSVEINLDDILFALALVNLPINYSLDENEKIIKESEMQEFVNRPFEEVFKK